MGPQLLNIEPERVGECILYEVGSCTKWTLPQPKPWFQMKGVKDEIRKGKREQCQETKGLTIQIKLLWKMLPSLTELAINSLFLQETMKNDKWSHSYTLKSIITKPYHCIHNKNIRQNFLLLKLIRQRPLLNCDFQRRQISIWSLWTAFSWFSFFLGTSFLKVFINEMHW